MSGRLREARRGPGGAERGMEQTMSRIGTIALLCAVSLTPASMAGVFVIEPTDEIGNGFGYRFNFK